MDKYKLWTQIPHLLREVSKKFDAHWMKRHRRFDTFTILCAVIKLVARCDESYLSMLRDFATNELPSSASSFSEARAKVPASIFSEIRRELTEFWNEAHPEVGDWHGFQVFAIDGSKLNVPRPLKKEGFYASPSSYYPQALVTSLLRVSDRTIHALDFSPRMSEREAALRLTEELGRNDLVVYDKGFLSFEFVCEHRIRGIDALFRVQGGNTFREVEEFRASNSRDKIVKINPNSETYRRALKSLSVDVLEPITLRLIKFFDGNEECIFATTVLRKDIPAKAFIELYRKRWRIEELYKVFKSRLEIEEFHSKTSNGVEQEIQAASILWNLTRKIEAFVPSSAFKKSSQLPTYIAVSN